MKIALSFALLTTVGCTLLAAYEGRNVENQMEEEAVSANNIKVDLIADTTETPAKTADTPYHISDSIAELSEHADITNDISYIMEYVPTPELEGYNLLWSDEFNGDTLDESIWSYDPQQPGHTNHELQEYTESTDNIYLQDGHLVIKAIKEKRDGEDYYTSGKIKSQNKQDFLYGKIVVSAKAPQGQGLWPAVWMMPTDESIYGKWPKCGEIDIMELKGDDVATVYSTLHFGKPNSTQQGIITLNKGNFSDDFHEYSLEWEPGEMRFYTDDRLVLSTNDWFTAEDNEDPQPYPAPFDQLFYMQLNLAVGGSWVGDPDDTTDFDNAEFQVDYVRVYQKDSYDTDVTRPEKVYKESDDDGNFVSNADFSHEEDLSDEEGWSFFQLDGGVAEAKMQDDAIAISTQDCGTQEYSVQLVQAGMPVLKDHTYRITFDIKADEKRDAVFCVSAPTAGWIRYLDETTLKVGTDWKTYTFEFTSKEDDDNNGRLEFNLGNHGYTSTTYITNVHYEDITK